MSLWQDYKQKRVDGILIEGVTRSMAPLLVDWLMEIANRHFFEPYQMAITIQNRLRINNVAVPRTRPNNYLEADDDYKFMAFLMGVAEQDGELFFVALDYLIQQIPYGFSLKLARILDDAGHKYQVQSMGEEASIVERISEEDRALMGDILKSKKVYASEFQDAFKELYGQKPNYTNAAGEAFQAIESALKYYLGDDKGQNLGALAGWLRDNRKSWTYNSPSDEQVDAENHFLSLVDFVNKSYRKVKHGQAQEKLSVNKKHAAVILRVVSLLIFELENTIDIHR